MQALEQCLSFLPYSLTEEEKSYVIAHEQAHINHYDNIWKPFGYMILSLHFFNSLCWVAFKLFTKDIELACDERVIRNFSIKDKKGVFYRTAPITTALEIHPDNRNSAIDNLQNPSFDFEQIPATLPVTEPATKVTEPSKPVAEKE